MQDAAAVPNVLAPIALAPKEIAPAMPHRVRHHAAKNKKLAAASNPFNIPPPTQICGGIIFISKT